MTSSEFIAEMNKGCGCVLGYSKYQRCNGTDGYCEDCISERKAVVKMVAQIEQDVDELKKRAIDLCPGQDYEDGFLSALTILKQNNSTYKKELEK